MNIDSEIRNSYPVPGQDPLSLLKDNSPIPPAGIFLQVKVDPDRQAANFFIAKGGMKWTKRSSEVNLQYANNGDRNPTGTTLLFEGKDYPHRNLELYDRPGAGYSGSRRADFDQVDLSGGSILITKSPHDLTNHANTFRMQLDSMEPGNCKDILRIFDISDIQGLIDAVNVVLEQIISLPIVDAKKAVQNLTQRMGD